MLHSSPWNLLNQIKPQEGTLSGLSLSLSEFDICFHPTLRESSPKAFDVAFPTSSTIETRSTSNWAMIRVRNSSSMQTLSMYISKCHQMPQADQIFGLSLAHRSAMSKVQCRCTTFCSDHLKVAHGSYVCRIHIHQECKEH